MSSLSQKFAAMPTWKRAAMVIPVAIVLFLILFGNRIFGSGTALPPSLPKPASLQHGVNNAPALPSTAKHS